VFCVSDNCTYRTYSHCLPSLTWQMSVSVNCDSQYVGTAVQGLSAQMGGPSSFGEFQIVLKVGLNWMECRNGGQQTQWSNLSSEGLFPLSEDKCWPPETRFSCCNIVWWCCGRVGGPSGYRSTTAAGFITCSVLVHVSALCAVSGHPRAWNLQCFLS
jgi:hypothetical protein